MRTREQIQSDLRSSQLCLTNAILKESHFRGELQQFDSKAFVEANNLEMKDVFTTDDCGQWVDTLDRYAAILKNEKPIKPFAEWNGRVYLSSDVINRTIPECRSCYIEHVKGYGK
jgi:hypothetical protein